MRCPFCQFPDNRVLESRSAESGQSVRRRRECLNCGRRFTTYERIEFVPVTIVKRSGEREAFDRNKLLAGLVQACHKTGVEAGEIELLVEAIEAELQQSVSRELSSEELGDLVIKRLQALNAIACVRFASLHGKFQSLQELEAFLNNIQVADQKSTEQHHPKSAEDPSLEEDPNAQVVLRSS